MEVSHEDLQSQVQSDPTAGGGGFDKHEIYAAAAVIFLWHIFTGPGEGEP